MTLIILLCYYYTGIDEQILNHSISFPKPNKTERGHLVMRVSFVNIYLLFEMRIMRIKVLTMRIVRIII